EVHPKSTFVGDVAGFSAGPGQLIYKGGARLGAPIFNQIAGRVAGSGMGSRLARYGTRLAGLGLVGAAEVAGTEATQGARNEGLLTGEAPTLDRRLELGEDALKEPLNYVGLPAISAGYRMLRGAGTKLSGLGTGTNASLTPRGVQRQVERATGGAVPSNATTANAVADLNAGLFGEGMGRQSVKDFRHLTAALRNADVPDQRIIEGFRRIANSDLAPGDRRDLTRLLEQEFAPEFPGVVPNLREFLLKVGIEGQPEIQQTLRGRSNTLRQSQADELRSVAREELGSLPRIQASDDIGLQLRDIGGDYDQLLASAPRNSEYAQEAAELALRSPELADALAARARNAGVDIETLVRRNPFAALHWVQHHITDPSLRPTRNSMQDLLERGVPGYKELRDEYHRVATARDALGYYDPQTGKYIPGIGDRLAGRGNSLTGAARNEMGADHITREYSRLAEFDDQAGKAADLSIRDMVTDPLRGTRATGLDNFGQDVAGARLGAMQTEGLTETLPHILGPRGQRLSDMVGRILDERQYLADIDPRTGSNTVNKAQATANGAQPISHGLGRVSTDDGAAAIADGALILSGNLPFVTVARRGFPMLSRTFQPRAETQARIAERLTRPLSTESQLPSIIDLGRASMRPNANRSGLPQLLSPFTDSAPPIGRESELGAMDPRILGIGARNDILTSAMENPTRNTIGKMMAEQRRSGSLPIVRLLQTEEGRVIAFDGTRQTHQDYADMMGMDISQLGRAVAHNTPDNPRNLQWLDANDQPWAFRSRANRNPDEILGEPINDPRLSPMQNRLVSMRRAGMTNEELAEHEDTTVNVVKSQLSQARRRAPDIEITRRQGGIRGDVQPIIRELTERYPDMTSAQIAERASARLGRTIQPNTVSSLRSQMRSGVAQGLEEGFVDPALLNAGANLILRGPVSGGLQGGMLGATLPAESPAELRRNIFAGTGAGVFGGGVRAARRNPRRTQTGMFTRRGNGIRHRNPNRMPTAPSPSLSQRDQAISLLNSGMSEQQIAREMSVSLDQLNAILRGVERPPLPFVAGG
ncbi:MAG: hypothetical protein AAF583_07480, partial [Pseudomonadota bacterium]